MKTRTHRARTWDIPDCVQQLVPHASEKALTDERQQTDGSRVRADPDADAKGTQGISPPMPEVAFGNYPWSSIGRQLRWACRPVTHSTLAPGPRSSPAQWTLNAPPAFGILL